MGDNSRRQMPVIDEEAGPSPSTSAASAHLELMNYSMINGAVVMEGKHQPNSSVKMGKSVAVRDKEKKVHRKSAQTKKKISPLPTKANRPPTVEIRKRLDAGRVALKELLKERRKNKIKKTSCATRIRVLVTIVGALMMSGGLMVLFFLIPMTIDPALATLTYDFNPRAIRCMVSDFRNVSINPNKAIKPWCSCTEGCTTDIFQCFQIIVNYRKEEVAVPDTWRQKRSVEYLQQRMYELEDTRIKRSSGEWDFYNASLLINVKGCGYPPDVNCSSFLEHYGRVDIHIPCYYSHLDPTLVVYRHDREKAVSDIIQSFGWTCGSILVGFGLVLFMQFPYKAVFQAMKSRQCCKRGLQKRKETKTDISEVEERSSVFHNDWYEVNT